MHISKRLTQIGSVAIYWLAQSRPAMASAKIMRSGAEQARPSGAPADLFGASYQAIINTALFIVGAAAVLMLIIGGLRYVISGGDKDAVEGAKNTILYAIVGIIVAVLAFAIVDFVLDRLAAGE